MDLVEKQYTSWVYPFPVEDMQKAIAEGTYIEVGDPTIDWPRYWPNKRKLDKLDILIAGCGTNQAAYYACRNPKWSVVGIDLSESSLAHQQKLKEKHKLTNLRLEKLNLTSIHTLGLDFDLIVSTGVLHHLPDPDKGLLALKSVLRPEGVIHLMVYGTSLRIGVYMMQEVFKELGFQQTKDDADLARYTVNSLHSDHALKRYMKDCEDIKYDAGIVDTFLHPQDRSYYVNEVYSFTRRAGLEFLSWRDPIDYCLEDHMPPQHPLWNKVSGISREKKAHICDLLVQERGTHYWIAAHPEYVSKVKIPLDSDDILNCTLILHPQSTILQKSNPQKKINVVAKRQKREFEIHYSMAKISEKLNATNSIKIVIDTLISDTNQREGMYQLAKAEVKRLYESGHLFVLLPIS